MTIANVRSPIEAVRRHGAYYTNTETAAFVAKHAIDDEVSRVLEPSFGDGSFLRAVRDIARPGTELVGVEISKRLCRDAIAAGLIPAEKVIAKDFLEVEPFPVDAVIGNPPYVRLRHLEPGAARTALTSARNVLGSAMATDGSLWMPFVLHALRFLRRGGKLALVLPFEMTHVKYARPLWRALAESFDSLRVIRVRERLFPEILQEVVLFFATGFGGPCSTVRFDVYERSVDLWSGVANNSTDIRVAALVKGEREFTRALLPRDLLELIDNAIAKTTERVRDRCVFHIGYVAGDKKFFHPSPDTIREHWLPSSALRRAAISARSLRGVGLRTSSMPRESTASLYLPDPHRLSQAEKAYVTHGGWLGVSLRYKCRVRDPWFVVPGVVVPDVLLSVFSSDPILMLNDAGLVASNSLLCGRVQGCSPGAFASSWYTSLTRLYAELEIHSLGGGVMVMIPGEVGRVRIPAPGEDGDERLDKVGELLRGGRIVEAYEAGDDLLRSSLQLSPKEVCSIREGVRILAGWRSASRQQRNYTRQTDGATPSMWTNGSSREITPFG